jgi:hypothetical protein
MLFAGLNLSFLPTNQLFQCPYVVIRYLSIQYCEKVDRARLMLFVCRWKARWTRRMSEATQSAPPAFPWARHLGLCCCITHRHVSPMIPCSEYLTICHVDDYGNVLNTPIRRSVQHAAGPEVVVEYAHSAVIEGNNRQTTGTHVECNTRRR